MLNREICSLTTQSEINLYSQKRDVIVARPFHFYRDKTIMDGGGSKNVPSSAIFPFCISNYAAEFINFQRYLKRNSFFLSLSLDKKWEKRKRGRRKERCGKEKGRGSVISNREKILPQQTSSPPLSSSSLSPSLVILLLVRVPIVYPRPPATPSLHQPRDRSST